jgi:hypothetical protein
VTTCTGAGGTGTKYTYAQLQGLWINAGGPAAAAPVAAAIALAESGGCTAALNLTDNNGTQTSVGLWQVSNGTHQYPASWATAAGNATEAVAKYKGASNTFSAWGTFVSGAYTAFLNPGTTPDTSVPSGSGTPAATLDSSASSTSTCAANWPSADLIVTSLGGGCMFSKAALRHVIGGALMVGGALIVLPGVLVLVAFTFRATGAMRAVAGAAEAISPGTAAVARASGAAGRATGASAKGRAERAPRQRVVTYD